MISELEKFNNREVDYTFEELEKYVKLIENEIINMHKYYFKLNIYGVECTCKMTYTSTLIFYSTNNYNQCLHLQHTDIKDAIQQLECVEDNYIFTYVDIVHGWKLINRFPHAVVKSDIDKLFDKIILNIL